MEDSHAHVGPQAAAVPAAAGRKVTQGKACSARNRSLHHLKWS